MQRLPVADVLLLLTYREAPFQTGQVTLASSLESAFYQSHMVVHGRPCNITLGGDAGHEVDCLGLGSSDRTSSVVVYVFTQGRSHRRTTAADSLALQRTVTGCMDLHPEQPRGNSGNHQLCRVPDSCSSCQIWGCSQDPRANEA